MGAADLTGGEAGLETVQAGPVARIRVAGPGRADKLNRMLNPPARHADAGPMFLDVERETYAKALPALLDRAGQYVLIHGENVIDVFETYRDAMDAGYDRFRTGPFLVHKIAQHDEVNYVSRVLW